MSAVPHCAWCKTTNVPLTRVGFEAASSGPGWTYHACTRCMKAHRIVPLARHPSNTDGAVRYWPTGVA